MSAAATTLDSEQTENALVLTLNGEARGNALNPAVITALREAIARAETDEPIRAIVLRARGKFFCTGADLGSFAAADYREAPSMGAASYAALLTTMLRSEVPIVTAVQGSAFGGGLGLVLASTFVIANDSVAFGTPEIQVGLFPMMLLPLLSRHLPRRRLLRMALFNEQMTAEEAERLGVVDRLVSAYSPEGAVFEKVNQIANLSRTAVAHGLRAFAAQDALAATTALPDLAQALESLAGTDEAQAAIAAFLSKRTKKKDD